MVIVTAGKRVTITDEAAIIVWDAEKKVEHFIRRAEFQTDAERMGFVVPTPGKPELAEIDNSVFGLLEDHTAARTYHYQRRRIGITCGMAIPEDVTPRRPAGRVEVVETKDLAGQRATVLSATDAGALRKWLEANDFPVTDATEDWAKYYVEKRWYFTAFKFLKNNKSKSLKFAAVKMSFPTETPVYPYKEPTAVDDKRGDRRSLKLILLASARMEGVQTDTNKLWAGQTEYAKPVGLLEARPWFGLLKLELPDAVWLTEMVDRSSPRPATGDIEFRKSADGHEKERPPIYVDAGRGSIGLASLGLLCMTGLALWFAGRRS